MSDNHQQYRVRATIYAGRDAILTDAEVLVGVARTPEGGVMVTGEVLGLLQPDADVPLSIHDQWGRIADIRFTHAIALEAGLGSSFFEIDGEAFAEIKPQA